MSRYSGRYYKGASKDIKAEKRAEAEARKVIPTITGGLDESAEVKLLTEIFTA